MMRKETPLVRIWPVLILVIAAVVLLYFLIHKR